MISAERAASRKQLIETIEAILQRWPHDEYGVFSWPTLCDVLNDRKVAPPYAEEWIPTNVYQYCSRYRIQPHKLLPERSNVASDGRGGYAFRDNDRIKARTVEEELVTQIRAAVQEVVDFYVNIPVHPADHQDGEPGCAAMLKEAIDKRLPCRTWADGELLDFLFKHKISVPIAHIQRKIGYPKRKAVRRL